jgi:hypothetical protein
MGRGVSALGRAPVGHGGVEGCGGRASIEKEIPLRRALPCPALCSAYSIVTAASVTALSMIDDRQDAWLVETGIMSIIDAMSLSDVINLSNE